MRLAPVITWVITHVFAHVKAHPFTRVASQTFSTSRKIQRTLLPIMSAKRTPPDDEIMALAAELRPLMKTGETIVPFIRRNQQRLRQLVEEESWATVARVMTALGITYSSGKPWTARYIANEFDRATMPRQRRRGSRTETPALSPGQEYEPAPGPGGTPPHTRQGENDSSAKTAAAMAPPSPIAPPPEKRFVFKRSPRLAPPRVSTEEEIARREVLDERLFGKK